MPFIEDSTEALTAVEEVLITGLSFTKLERLRKRLIRAVVTEQVPIAQARRLVQLAASLEPGALFNNYFDEVYLAASFRSKARLLVVDSLLAPYYGLVTGAMSELRLAGIDPVITDMWLQHFRQDNGLYRAQVIASMCVVGAFSDLDFTVSV
jgi:hypothetical protein